MCEKEDAAQVKNSLIELRKAIEAKELTTDVSKFNDSFLLRFLRSKNFDVDAAALQFTKYVKSKAKIPELFLYPSELKMVFDDNILSCLKEKTPKGETICVLRLANWLEDNYDYDCILAAAFVSLEALLFDEDAQKHGVVQIVDLKDVDFDQLVSIEGYQVKRLTKIFNKMLPVKVNSIYVVNDEKKAKMMSKKLKERVTEEEFNKFHFFGTELEAFHENIPPKILPAELGGETGPFSSEQWFKTLMSYEDQIKDIWSLIDVPSYD